MTRNEAHVTIDCRHPQADDLYEKCVNAWYDAGYIQYSSYDCVMTMVKADGSVVEISYGCIRGYAPK